MMNEVSLVSSKKSGNNFLREVLQVPRYGYIRNAQFYKPTTSELLLEFLFRMNLMSSRKNWLNLLSWTATFSLIIPFFIFLFQYLNWQNFFIGFVYSMVILGSHGTFWLHRYGTHRAFTVRNKFLLQIFRNLVIKIIPEEIYVVSHHVHHRYCDQPGDPYNVHGGWLYCFLADAIHQPISKNLSKTDYLKLSGLMAHTGIKVNSFPQYQKWGTLCHPLNTVLHYCLNWAAWFFIFYYLGGISMAVTIFGSACIWAFGVRTFNFDGHGRGRTSQKEGVDFNKKDTSINQLWPGYVAGEWHNNHHLYPSSARSGFLSYQLDLPWIFIYLCSKLGLITSFKDDKKVFLNKHYLPYKQVENKNELQSV